MASPPTFRHPRYRILRLLGEGGMGRVYLASDRLEGGHRVALKVYPARYYDERLKKEFLALRQLHHPSIARALHFGLSETDGAPFFTMEYVEGEPIDRYLASLGGTREDVFPKQRLALGLHLLGALTAAVAYLHRRGVLHSDIKPENILVMDLGPEIKPRPLLIDFGLVRAAKTMAPLAQGTLPFAAPEAFRGDPPSPASDVYSLAATFYKVFSGRYPVEGSDYASFARAHRSERAAPIPELPSPLGRLLLRGLAKDPARRFRDADELYRALKRPLLSGLTERLPLRSRVLFHEPDFVGRSRELESARLWLDSDRRKSPILKVCAGAGWGKTRFLEEVQTLLETKGKNVIAARMRDGEEGSLLLQCARQALFLVKASQEKRRRPRQDLKTLHAVLKRAARAGKKAPSGEDAQILKRGVANSLLPLLRDDTFLFIDDLHLAEPMEQEAVKELQRMLEAEPQPPGGGILAALGASEVQPDGPSARIDLGPLSLSEALKIDLEGLDGALAGLSPERVKKLKRKLHREVGGHPLFYVRGLLHLAGETHAMSQLAPVRNVLATVEHISGPERKVAACLACLGRAASALELSRILSMGRDPMTAVLRGLRLSGLLAAGGPTGRIIHDSVSKAILQSVSPAERIAHHASLATFFARGGTSTGLLEAAWHSFRAQNADQAISLAKEWMDEGVPVSRSLGDKAVEVLRQSAAAVPGPASEGFLEAQGDVLEKLGRYNESLSARRELLKAWTREKRSGPPGCLLRLYRKLGSVCHRTGKIDLALRYLEHCVQPKAESSEPVESLQARAELALLRHFRGEADLALMHSQRGVLIWKRSSSQTRQRTLQSAINFHGILGQIHIRRLELGSSIVFLEEGLKLAQKGGSRANIALLLNNLGLAHHLAGRFGKAWSIFQRAESIALELGDAAALVSIRSNKAQILAKKGRFRAAQEVLDEMGESHAATQSKRFHFFSLYTRGLILNLLRSSADELWSSIERLGSEMNDAFLVGFARLYRAEGLILSGHYSAARGLLSLAAEPRAERLLSMLKIARLSLVEALAGHGPLARKLRLSLDGQGMPSLFHAWNLHYAGLSALETGDWNEAKAKLEAARGLFQQTGFAAAELESELCLADLYLRWSSTAPSHLSRAEKEIKAARRVAIEPPLDVSPRSRELRIALLEARAILFRLASTRDSSSSKKILGKPPDREALRGALSDLLAGAAGDPALETDPDLRLLLEVVSAASARLDGDPQKASQALARLERARKEIARQLQGADVHSYLGRDPWSRFGLERLRPPPGRPVLTARHAEGLASVLTALGGAPSPTGGHARPTPEAPIQRALAEIGRRTGACRAEFASGGELVAAWAAGNPRARCLFEATCKFQGKRVGALRVWRSSSPAFSASEEAFLQAAAQALLPYLPPGAHQPEASSSPLPLEETQLLPGASRLQQTQKLPPRLEKTAALLQFLKAEGMTAPGREMQKVARAIQAFSRTELPVLITGESGTGKNLVAKVLHRLSLRAKGPFLTQNVSAVPPDLFESDLFGYERGAFTGADRTRSGFLFRAQTGTFHLEEIGDLEPSLQQHLLQVIEEKAVRPLGATSSRPIDVRFLASTHRDIEGMVRRGEFRKDLFFRLSGARIHVPPLRHRLDDIPELVSHYWRELTGSAARFSPAAMKVLLEHEWPGNVRELISVLRRLSLEATRAPEASDVQAALGEKISRGLFPPGIFESRTFEELQRDLEESYLVHLSQKHEGDLARIAGAMNTTTRSIYRKFERLGLKPKSLRK